MQKLFCCLRCWNMPKRVFRTVFVGLGGEVAKILFHEVFGSLEAAKPFFPAMLGGLEAVKPVFPAVDGGLDVAKQLFPATFGGPGPPARPPTSERAEAMEGIRGGHKSFTQDLGLEHLDLGLLAWCMSSHVLFAP